MSLATHICSGFDEYASHLSNPLILLQVSTLPNLTISKWYCHAIRTGFEQFTNMICSHVNLQRDTLSQCPYFWIHVQTQPRCEGSSWSPLVLWLRLMHGTQSAWGRRPGRSCKKPLEPLRLQESSRPLSLMIVLWDFIREAFSCMLSRSSSLVWKNQQIRSFRGWNHGPYRFGK